MHKFCTDCVYEKIPAFIKEKYNEYIYPKFIECPLEEDEKVAGCVVKHYTIKFDEFIKALIDKNMLKKEEIVELIKLGFI